MTHQHVALLDPRGERRRGLRERRRSNIVHQIGAEGIRIVVVHGRVGAERAVIDEALKGGHIGIRLIGGLFGDQQRIGEGRRRLLEDLGRQSAAVHVHRRIEVEERRPPAAVRVADLVDVLLRHLGGFEVVLRGGTVGVDDELLRTDADAHADPRGRHDLEVGVVQLHAVVGRAGYLDHGLHLGRGRGDLVRRADVAGVLRVFLPFDVPGDDSLGVHVLRVLDIALRLRQNLLLKLHQAGPGVDVEVARIRIVIVAAGIVRIALRRVGVAAPGGRAGQKYRADDAAIIPFELRRIGRGKALVGIRGDCTRRRARGREPERDGKAIGLSGVHRTVVMGCEDRGAVRRSAADQRRERVAGAAGDEAGIERFRGRRGHRDHLARAVVRHRDPGGLDVVGELVVGGVGKGGGQLGKVEGQRIDRGAVEDNAGVGVVGRGHDHVQVVTALRILQRDRAPLIVERPGLRRLVPRAAVIVLAPAILSRGDRIAVHVAREHVIDVKGVPGKGAGVFEGHAVIGEGLESVVSEGDLQSALRLHHTCRKRCKRHTLRGKAKQPGNGIRQSHSSSLDRMQFMLSVWNTGVG